MEKDLKYIISNNGIITIAESRTLDAPIMEKISRQGVNNLLREFNIAVTKEEGNRVLFTRVLNDVSKIGIETLQKEGDRLTASINNFLKCLDAEGEEIVIATLTGTFDGKGKLIGIHVKINEKFRPQSEQAM